MIENMHILIKITFIFFVPLSQTAKIFSNRRSRFEVPKYGYQNLLHFDSVFMPHGSTNINFTVCLGDLFLIFFL